jgi:hypothetical protein
MKPRSVNPIRFKNFGDLQLDDMLLVCAEIKANKEEIYDFSPTILDGDEEFFPYLNALKAHAKTTHNDINEKFAYKGTTHWVTGEIHINQKGNVEVLLIDSLGAENKEDALSGAKNTIHSAFADSPVTVFVSKEKRQFSPLGCSAFALNDLRQLHTVDQYIKEDNILLYCANKDNQVKKPFAAFSSIKLWKPNPTTTVEVLLPPLFLETTQSAIALEKLVTSKDPRLQPSAMPMNKKTTFEQTDNLTAIRRNYEETETKEGKKMQNTRLAKKLTKMGEDTEEFFEGRSAKEISDLTESFTLSTLNERLNERYPKQSLNPEQP